MTDHLKMLKKTLKLIDHASVWISFVPMWAIVLIVFVDVCGRYLLNKPLMAAYDLVEQSLVVLAGFSIALATIDGIHPAIDLVTTHFPRMVRTVMDKAYTLLGFATCMVLTYALWQMALGELRMNTTLVILKVNPAPFIFSLAIGIFLCGLACLIQTFLSTDEHKDKEEPYSE
jgi:TRAP-type C4-dicarboxylate transport system permease small subunit